MKDYPSIPGSLGQEYQEFDAYVFDKQDGSNLRAELNKKRGFYKFGTRNRMFDVTDPVFGKGVSLFKSIFEERVMKLATDNKWESVVVFAEFVGDHSFAGQHDPADNHTLFLFDIAPHRQGILGPSDFLKFTENWSNTIAFLGVQKWTRGFVQMVKDDKIAGVTFEGVVGKAGQGHQQTRAKAKTQKWVDKVLARYNADDAQKLINS